MDLDGGLVTAPALTPSPASGAVPVLGPALTWLTASLGPAKVDLLLVVVAAVAVLVVTVVH